MLDSRWVGPALIFFAGAVLGRVMGLKPLARGAMTVASMAGVGAAAAPVRHTRAQRRRVTHRSAARRPARKPRAA